MAIVLFDHIDVVFYQHEEKFDFIRIFLKESLWIVIYQAKKLLIIYTFCISNNTSSDLVIEW